MSKTMKQALVYLLAFCLLSGTFAATAAAAGNEQTLFSVSVSSFVQSGIVILSTLLTIVFLARRDRQKSKQEESINK